MSIQGINPATGGAGFLPGIGRPRPGDESERSRVDTTEVAKANPQATRPQAARGGRDIVPAEAPPGTDPALWEVLSEDERAFFARARSMGPLTYGPGVSRASSVPAGLQGGRIDVKV